jgi:hypothetical protein
MQVAVAEVVVFVVVQLLLQVEQVEQADTQLELHLSQQALLTQLQ